MENVNDLEISIFGQKFINPFIVGACPSTRDADHIIRAATLGWGGAVTKTLTSHPPYIKNPTPFISSYSYNKNVIGLFNNETFSDPGIADWCNCLIPRIKKKVYPEFKLIVSIMEGENPEDWKKSIDLVQKSGADIIEMNVSCPHGAPQKYMGKFIGDDPDLLFKIISKCTGSLGAPLVVKISAETVSLENSVQACKSGGASGISTTNTLLSVAGININNYLPNLRFHDKASFAGYSGAAVKPIALRAVLQVALSSDIPIIGVGGISSWQEAVEYFLCGAKAVQLATSVMLNGFEIIDDLKKGLQNYLCEHEETLEGIRGKSKKYFVETADLLNQDCYQVATVNPNLCINCIACIKVCADGSVNCISKGDNLVTIERKKCNGCGLCLNICPTNALYMSDK